MDDYERNLRNVIRVLISRLAHTRKNLMAANTAIQAISNMSRDERGALTAAQIQAELKSLQRQLAEQPDQAFVEIDQLLEGKEPFYDRLAKFVSEIRW